jgi:predicted SPOUT superfamily RNA methylase MTH1
MVVPSQLFFCQCGSFPPPQQAFKHDVPYRFAIPPWMIRLLFPTEQNIKHISVFFLKTKREHKQKQTNRENHERNKGNKRKLNRNKQKQRKRLGGDWV